MISGVELVVATVTVTDVNVVEAMLILWYSKNMLIMLVPMSATL